MIGMSAFKEMYEAVKKTPFFWIDDVFITGLLPQKVKERIYYISSISKLCLNPKLALANLVTDDEPLRCNIVHSYRPKTMTKLWKLLLKKISPNHRKMLNPEIFSNSKYPRAR